jgi:hypothetical protein
VTVELSDPFAREFATVERMLEDRVLGVVY